MDTASWFEPVRAYCERTDAKFWSEPLNALSNGAFLVAAVAAGFAARGPSRDPAGLSLAILVAVVGIGSFLFHTLANCWSMLADVIPIAVFIHAYFFLAMRRFFGLGTAAALAVTLAFALAGFGLAPALDAVTGLSTTALTNGSVDYVPAILALVGVGALLAGRRDPARRSAGRVLLASAAVFLLSLTFRTVDATVCPRLPFGTHMVWHGLNAAVLYGLIAAAIRFRRDASAKPGAISAGHSQTRRITRRRGLGG